MNDASGLSQTTYAKLSNQRVRVSNGTLLPTGEDTLCGGSNTDYSILSIGAGSDLCSDFSDHGLASPNNLSVCFEETPKDLKGTYSCTSFVGALPPSSKYSGSLVTAQSDGSEGNYYVATLEFETAPVSITGATAVISMDSAPGTCLLDSDSPELELLISTEIANITGLTVVFFTFVWAYEGLLRIDPGLS